MAFSYLCASVLLVVSVSAQQYGGYGQQQGYGGYGQQQAATYHQEEYAPAHYSYSYAVKDEHTHDMKSHQESRQGDKTEGEYSLLEADGTTRTVKYYVDGKSGFVAQVIRSGTPNVVPVVQKVVPIIKSAVVAAHVQPLVHQTATYIPASNNVGGHATSYVNRNQVQGGYKAGVQQGYGQANSFVSGGNFGQQAGYNSGYRSY